MNEEAKSPEAEETREKLMKLYKESVKEIQVGEVVPGKVICISKDYVMVDIGFKSEGAVPVSEFTNSSGELSVKEGDTVEVLFEGVNQTHGSISISRKKAIEIKTWEKIERAHTQNEIIHGEIVKRIKGGFTVDIGVPAFLPGSQVDIKPIRDYDSFVGKDYPFKIIKYNKRLHNIILSRRLILEEEKERQRKHILATLKEGAIVYGRVKNITDYGVFVDLGGIDGLLHITDISWEKIGHPSDKFEVGDEVRVEVLKFNSEKREISLGMKQLTPDPWATVPEKYPIGATVKGQVVNLTDYGAFVKLKEGVRGLIHISEMAWSKKRIRHPSELISVGDVVEVEILDEDVKRRRISLGLKQIGPDPWEIVQEKYPVDSIVEGKVKNITKFGIFVEVVEGIDGLIHISDISWTKRIKHPRDLYKKGQVVKAKVLEINKEKGKLALGIKQLTPNPWESIPGKYPLGSIITGKITHITNFGLFVEIEEGIEGLVHISEIYQEKVKNLNDDFKIGNIIETKVIRVSSEEKKLGLSIKQLEQENPISYKYVSNSKGALKLGDLIKSRT